MKKSKKGFTILELLVVISIIAIVATLATGAAMKSIRQGRKRRIETMQTVLQMALVNYRTQQGEWPFKIEEMEHEKEEENNKEKDKLDTYYIRGKKNAHVFTKLYGKKQNGVSNYLDPSVFFVCYKGGRRLLKDVPEKDREDLPIGYPDPQNQDIFKYFTIKYIPLTDTVTVER